jgi:hypothetical protein
MSGTPPPSGDLPSPLEGGRRLQHRGHEIVIHHESAPNGRRLCFVFLSDPFDPRRELKIFKGRADEVAGAEKEALAAALDYLDDPSRGGASSILPGRHTLDIAGRRVDIFCEPVGEGRWQAFPFQYRPDGSTVLILRFHMHEAIVGGSPAEAMSACIRRLESYFRP